MSEILEFYPGKEIDLDALARQLIGFGYRRQAQFAAKGEFAVRGGILDIFPVHFSLPVRMDLSQDTV